jgi:hypothetical protein
MGNTINTNLDRGQIGAIIIVLIGLAIFIGAILLVKPKHPPQFRYNRRLTN